MIKNELERGWLAGILEGEGSFLLRRGKYPRISLAMTDEDIIKRVRDMIAPSNYIGTQYRPGDRKPIYCVEMYSNLAIDVMLVVRDLMGERRRAKIDEILATADWNTNDRKLPTGIYWHQNRYEVKHKGEYLGRFNSLEKAVAKRREAECLLSN